MQILLGLVSSHFVNSHLVNVDKVGIDEVGIDKVHFKKSKNVMLHCKNIWVTSTILWSSQLHACCVRDTLQTSRDASNLVESL